MINQKKIAILGGPGSGKSTQCAHIFATFKSKGLKVEQIQEWVREEINKGMDMSNPMIQFLIYEEQKKKEDCVPKEIEYVVTDSPTLLSYIYAVMNGNLERDKYLFNKMYANYINDLSEYDYIFICKREKAYVQDGTRKQTIEEAKKLDDLIIQSLEFHKVNYIVLSGTTEERTQHVYDAMKGDIPIGTDIGYCHNSFAVVDREMTRRITCGDTLS